MLTAAGSRDLDLLATGRLLEETVAPDGQARQRRISAFRCRMALTSRDILHQHHRVGREAASAFRIQPVIESDWGLSGDRHDR